MKRRVKVSKEELPEEISEWQEAMLEIEGLVYEEVSKLQKKKDFYMADLLKKSLHIIKRGY
jgi:hypothetical protein